MNESSKIQEAEVQLEKREYYQPLEAPMVSNTQTKVNQPIIDKLHRGKHIDDMTKKWLAQTPSPPPKNSCFLHAYKNPQTCSGRKTDHFRLWRPNWKNILFCGHTATAYPSWETRGWLVGARGNKSGKEMKPARLHFLARLISSRPNYNRPWVSEDAAYRTKTTILHKGYNWFHQFYRKHKDRPRHNFSSNGRF